MGLAVWPEFTVALLVAAALPAAAQPPDAVRDSNSAGAHLSPVAFNPPFDQNLSLTITDRRLLPDGREVMFLISNRLRFTRGEGGMIATLRRDSIDCSGSETVCTTYRRAMAGWVGTIERFAVGADGQISPLVASDPSVAGEGVPAAEAAIAYVESQQPGALGMAELREALRYVGQSLEAAALSGLSPHPPEDIEVTPLSDQHVDIVYRTRIQLDSDPTVAIVRDRRDRIDTTTGLVIESIVTSRDGALAATSDVPPFSDRRWSLAR